MKIIIMGAGLLGVTTAYFLGRQGHEVIVLERQQGPALETSFANGGMITPSQADPWNKPGIFRKLLAWMGDEDAPFLLRANAVLPLLGWGISFIRNSGMQRYLLNMQKNAKLAAYSLNILKQLRQQHDMHYDETDKGTLKIYKDDKSLQEGLQLSERFSDAGIQFKLLNGQEVLTLEPALNDVSDGIMGGIYYPDDEAGDAYEFCRLLARQAEINGVQFKYQIDVIGLECSAGGISGVESTDGRYVADAYVLAMGSYSALLAKQVNIDLPIRPVKGYSLTLELNGWQTGPTIPVIDESMHTAVVPLGCRLRVAGTAEFSGYNIDISQSRIDNMFRFVSTLYPEFAAFLDRSSALQWVGLRPYTCDGVPLLGRTPLNNLYLNTGHGHLGWTMASGSGKLVADLISQRETALDISPYQLDRF